MKNVHQLMDIVIDEIIPNGNDFVAIVTGEEGSSKSTFLLNCVEYWCMKKFGKCTKDDVKYVTLHGKEFVDRLSDLPDRSLLGFDEATQINARDAMTKFNKTINKAYTIIRKKGYFTFLVVPRLFSLEVFMRRDRAHALFHVYRKGRVGYYDKELLEMINMRYAQTKGDYRIVKHAKVRPLWNDSFPKYDKKVMWAPYLVKKDELITDVGKELKAMYEVIEAKSNVKPRFKAKCKQCGHEWMPRSETPPICSACKSPKWNIGTNSHSQVSASV